MSMAHKGTRPLETPRLILRRFTADDAQAMYDSWASDPEVARYLTWPPHESVEVTRALLEDWTGHYAEPNYYNWVMALEETGQIIGNVSVVRSDERIDEVELGYCMSRAFWGKGYMPEAVSAVIGYFFTEVGANRVSAKHEVENAKSGRVMQKAGMRFEGVRRQGFLGNRGIVDVACYAILAEDWKKSLDERR